jgi:hypothetical protein
LFSTALLKFKFNAIPIIFCLCLLPELSRLLLELPRPLLELLRLLPELLRLLLPRLLLLQLELQRLLQQTDSQPRLLNQG